MTDRELLELAAKAYFGNEIDDVVSVDWCDSDECIEFAHADNQDHNGNDVLVLWNPLTDDGDALRLAVKLRMLVSITTESCRAETLPVLGLISCDGAMRHRAANTPLTPSRVRGGLWQHERAGCGGVARFQLPGVEVWCRTASKQNRG